MPPAVQSAAIFQYVWKDEEKRRKKEKKEKKEEGERGGRSEEYSAIFLRF